MASAPLVRIENLNVSFRGAVAVKDVSISLSKGEMLGVVGESGSGKSVTWLALMRLLPKTAAVGGNIMLGGDSLLEMPLHDIEKIRGRRVALISQDPGSALNPILTIERQLGEALSRHKGLSGSSIRSEAKRLLDLVGLPDPAGRLRCYPHEMSGGQNQRILIAMALAGDPDLLIADEPTTALDVTIQAQILELLQTIRSERNMAIVLISHDLGLIGENCERVCVMYAGSIVEYGPTASIFENPKHPYTHGLIGALPSMDSDKALVAIPGVVPSALDRPFGCAFAPRCSDATEQCRAKDPVLVPCGEDHFHACIERVSLLAAAGASEGMVGRPEFKL